MLPLDEDWNRGLGRSPYRLRFELNQGGGYVPMFASAFDRARELARATLGSAEVTAIVAAQPDAWSAPWGEERYGPPRDPFAILAEMGVATDTPLATWQAQPYLAEDEEAAPWAHRAVTVGWREADILLWSAIGQDIGIRPVAPVLAWLVDRERAVSVFAYDDRGMDITALAADTVRPLADRLDAWLLDHDRPRMAAAFGEPPTAG